MVISTKCATVFIGAGDLPVHYENGKSKKQEVKLKKQKIYIRYNTLRGIPLRVIKEAYTTRYN